MAVSQTISRHYSAHVAHQQACWEESLTAEGFDCAVIHAGSQIISFLDDYHYPFRPNPHFLSWLPLTRHDESVLVVRPGEKPVLYYYQPDDYWYLPPSDPDAWWADEFDVQPMREPGAWRNGSIGGRVAYIGDAPELRDEQILNPERLVNRIHLHRTRKTHYELACHAEANKVGAIAHRVAEEAYREGCSEFEIHQRYLSAGGMEDAQLPYGNIVALNRHGAVLHYQQREREAPEELYSFLIDGGATVHAYCSDITRTYTVRVGEFAEMILAMDEMQQGLCDAMRPGVDYRDLHVGTHRKIAAILAGFGVINISAEDAVETGLSSVFFPHGLGHFLGLQTHDVAGLIADADGTGIPRPDGHPYLRLTRVLEPGNVLTVEPGFYFIDTLLQKWKTNGDASAVNWDKVEALSPFGGIRIEDNVVVTEDEPLNLTREAFAAVSDTS